MKLYAVVAIAIAVSFSACTPRSAAPRPDEESLSPDAASIQLVDEAATEWDSAHAPISELPESDFEMALREFGVDPTSMVSQNGPGALSDELWRTATNFFGYLPLNAGPQDVFQNAFTVTPDSTLRGKRIKLTLDRIKIQKYPGGGNNGTHSIVVNFFGQTQIDRALEPLTHSVGLTARTGDEPGTAGKSIFVGLNVGTEGVNLKGSTINVKTEKDKTFFRILSGQLFAQGLRLIDTAQPVLRPLTELAGAVQQELADRNKGVTVQQFDLGLDLSAVSTRVRLREGSYVVLQIPPEDARTWNWADWHFVEGQIRRKDSSATPRFNYIVLGVSRFTETGE